MKIIVVEDEAPIREGIGRILQKLSPEYQVAGLAENGAKGLELIKEIHPDLIIMDIQMPQLDGLGMLTQIRREGIRSKVIVLTAYSDFNYAKEAIELGIENYLLKPIKIKELQDAMSAVQKKIEQEHRNSAGALLDSTFLGAITGSLKVNHELQKDLIQEYQLDIHGRLIIFDIYLEHMTEEKAESMIRSIQMISEQTGLFFEYHYVLYDKKLILFILYNLKQEEDLYHYFQNHVIPKFTLKSEDSIFIWKEMNGFAGLKEALEQITKTREWNLILGQGILINEDKINSIHVQPYKYPAELERRVRHAVIHQNYTEVMECFYAFKKMCIGNIYEPKEIKEAVIRLCWLILGVAKESGMTADMPAQETLQSISDAVTWQHLEFTLKELINNIKIRHSENYEQDNGSIIQKAQQIIQNEYQNGLTLEELAQKLYITVEYLSGLFKKETGLTFSETIRAIRINKIKTLLLETHLKLNQIAELTGYADSKYMSKVFKDETGMTPAEYRKSNIE